MTTHPSNGVPKHHPLQVAIMPGMPVCEMAHGVPGNIVGITQAFCVYRLADTETLCVSNWRDIALGNVCPAPSLLSPDVTENDQRNASAALLRELLGLEHVATLTSAQQAAMDELIEFLCRP